jgi:putative hemolysin
VSSRPSRLRTLAEKGIGGAGAALALAADPGRFLSTVQIGITLVGVLSGAFSGATLGLRLTAWLREVGVPDSAAGALGVGVVVAAITYGSLIMGELVPKQIALRDPERVAIRVAPAMAVLATVAAPLVSLLAVSGHAVLSLLGQSGRRADKVTEEEVKTIIAEAEASGTIESDERRLMAGVLRLGDRPVRAVMTPRTEVDWIDLADEEEEIRATLVESSHSRLPAADGEADEMIGVVHVRELLAAMLAGKGLDIRAYVRAAPIVPDNVDALDVLPILRDAEVPMGLVHDEYGHFEGVVTPADLLEAIAGEFRTHDEEPAAVRREDGSWLLAGHMPADDMMHLLEIALPERRDYATLAGYVLANFNRFPQIGEHFDDGGWRFEVVDLDGRRIDKVLASRLPP